MRPALLATIATVLLQAGCTNQSDPQTEMTGAINAAIEIEIAIRLHPFEPGDGFTDGEFVVVSSSVIPVRSDGRPGQAISNNNGVVMELQWDDARLTQTRDDQHQPFQSQVSLKNARFSIQNQLAMPNGVLHQIETAQSSLTLDKTFAPMISPLRFSAPADGGEQELVIRARLLPASSPARPLNLSITAVGPVSRSILW